MVEASMIIYQIKSSLIDIQNLKNSFEDVQEHKKNKLDQAQRIASQLVAEV